MWIVAALVLFALLSAALAWQLGRVPRAKRPPPVEVGDAPAAVPRLQDLLPRQSQVPSEPVAGAVRTSTSERAPARTSRSQPGRPPIHSVDALLQEVLAESHVPTPPERKPPLQLEQTESRVLLLHEDDALVDEPTGPAERIVVSAWADSDAGRRREKNEDAFLSLQAQSLFAVADGMGGYHGGQVASRLALDALRDALAESSRNCTVGASQEMPRRARELACAFQAANRAVFDRAAATPALAEMGTTLVAARFAVDKQQVYIGHVGDSRCYRLRGDRLTLLTADHTMRSLGMTGPHADHLSRAIGLGPSISIDILVDRPRPRDVYLLCSDGLSKMLSDMDIRNTLLSEADMEAAVYALIERANDAGGRDNVTVVLMQILDVPVRPAGAKL